MTRDRTIIAILTNAINHLWDGEAAYGNLLYRHMPEYMCHAVEYAIAEVVHGDRSIQFYLQNEEVYGGELHEKIMATIPGSMTADSYLRNKGVYGTQAVQAFRKSSLEAILAEYQAVQAFRKSSLEAILAEYQAKE